MGKAPTVRDVARAAGVSIAVVSYAFNRSDRVASATRERVLAAAAALGHRDPTPPLGPCGWVATRRSPWSG